MAAGALSLRSEGRRRDIGKTDAACVYPHLKSEARQTTRIAAKPEPRLARGLLPDAKRGSVSPLGGVATPAPNKPGMKW